VHSATIPRSSPLLQHTTVAILDACIWSCTAMSRCALTALTRTELHVLAAHNRLAPRNVPLQGVDLAIAKGVLRSIEPLPYRAIRVEGKSTDAIVGEITASLPVGRGAVVVLVGLSGTGKGTTVARLAQVQTKHKAAPSRVGLSFDLTTPCTMRRFF